MLVVIGLPSPTHSFIEGLRPSFSAGPSHCSLSFSSSGLTTWFPRLFSVTSEHIRLYFLLFFVLHFLVVGFVRQTEPTHVGFRARVKIASRIVSYRIVWIVSVLHLVVIFIETLETKTDTDTNMFAARPDRCGLETSASLLVGDGLSFHSLTINGVRPTP